MIIPEQYRSYLSRESRWLPATDWNVKLFGAHMQQVKQGWRVPTESHLAFELILILEGVQTTSMENIHYELHQGDILLIPPGCRHTNECNQEQGLTYFIAHFNVDEVLFRQEMSQHVQWLFPNGSEDNQRIKDIMLKWVELLNRNEEYTTPDLFRMQAGLLEILAVLAERSSSRAKEAVSPTVAHYAKLIAEAIKSQFNVDHIRDGGLGEKVIRIEEIASSLQISTGYALETFQKVYGISPRKYLSELKLHEAKQLIHQPDLSLTRIATMLGYSSLAHFSRQFRRWTGMSPSEYRQTVGGIHFFE
ncbi:helix-turn-helix domain-containing protein [Paenibacillus sp. MER 99-2]|uniref:AraC family transcriptional regulator n=1 Tax=Paenibacillus sp. MER 99-2 TaxID=2939572 RepID=UPI00203C3090|nr:helix-turn-helix domain-containing protein [Paenibacillus sp. MER 99-2]MCM3173687.1 AraC family transcriptional regulator [Paenibacillus sp. MER 99-2]